ncbi:unnamed protein product [Prunus armeniaca]
MGDSQQGNNKGKGKEKENYESWTMDDTNELLHLLVDAINSGLRDAKQNVERVILPRLNAKIRFPKTYNHYLSRMKWFKKQYNKMSMLMRNNSGLLRNKAQGFTLISRIALELLMVHIFRQCGWEGSTHDSKLLNNALSRRNGLQVPQGKYFLVDCGFPNRRQFLAPFQGVRYHLQDFAGHGNDPQNENELFNLCHASLRTVIERIFGIFKSRFTIFKSAPPFPFKT